MHILVTISQHMIGGVTHSAVDFFMIFSLIYTRQQSTIPSIYSSNQFATSIVHFAVYIFSDFKMPIGLHFAA